MSNSTALMRAVAAGVRANIPTLLWGNPGQGKTAKLSDCARAWNRHLEVVVGSVREASDYLGLPIEVDGVVNYSPPSWATRLNDHTEGAILFLDEVNISSLSVQKASLRITQERVVGELPLGDHVSILAAANPVDTATGGDDLMPAVANRFMHLDWHFDSAEWLNGIGTGFAHTEIESIDQMIGVHDPKTAARAVTMVTGFLEANRAQLAPAVPEDPTASGRAWASPRSWSNVIAVLSELDPKDDAAAILVVTGLVGEGAANEYFAWVSQNDLHNPAEVLADPSIVDWKGDRPDRLFALMRGVNALVLSDGSKKVWEQGVKALIACANGGRPDVALPYAQTLANNMPEGATIPQAFLDAFTDLTQRVGRVRAAA